MARIASGYRWRAAQTSPNGAQNGVVAVHSTRHGATVIGANPPILNGWKKGAENEGEKLRIRPP